MISTFDKFTNKGEIDFSDCIDGTYIVKIATEKEVLIRKVIKY